METLHQPDDIINQRYRIVTPLGQGSTGTTYEAEDLTNYQRVAIKAVSLRQATDWKILELFEREARVLGNLNHAHIPNYLDYFQIETPEELRFYLVRELIEGESLATMVEKNWQPTETQVKDIGIQVLKILEYLHSFAPPVIHRDIKPQNIIRRPDGGVYLVDFGAVQDVYRNTLTLGGTFVGTLGYMPLEQFRGQVKPASDLYSLGASLLFLLTGKSPADLPQVRMKIDWRSQVKISADFANWLEKMLEPALEDRFESAKEALTALLSNVQTRKLPFLKTQNHPPEGSRVNVEISENQAVIYFPPSGWGCGSIFLTLILVPLTLRGLFFVLSGISLADLELGFFILAGLLGFFWYILIAEMTRKIRIEINPHTFTIESNFCFFYRRKIQGKTTNVEKVEIEIREALIQHKSSRKKQKIYTCVIWEGIRQYEFGYGLSLSAKKWLVAEMSHLIKLMQS